MLTWVEISTSAINHNLAQFKKLLSPGVALMPVIKSNAYGHGIDGVSTICVQSKLVDTLCVVSLTEALFLVEKKVNKPILIIGFYELDEEPLMQAVKNKNKVSFVVDTIEQAIILNKVGESARKHIPVHIKVDSGTTRIGVLPNNVLKFIATLQKRCPALSIEGLWTHFASSESDPTFTRKQHRVFASVLEECRNKNITFSSVHEACSAASTLAPYTHQNAVRLGIELYGLHPSRATRKRIVLRPALSWYTTIIQTKKIEPGTTVSYGRTYTAKRPMRIAVLPVGYYDGYDRKLSNAGEVLIGGKRCTVLGRVCMNLTMVDVTQVPKAKVGDTVVLLGKAKNEAITADELADKIGTINYEVVTRIGAHIPRIIKK